MKSGNVISQISQGNKDGLWNQARWMRVLGLGQTWKCHNQLKLAGKWSSLESNCLSPGFGCGFSFRVLSPAKTGAEHYPGVYISSVLPRLWESRVLLAELSMACGLSLGWAAEGSLSGRRLWETRKRGPELVWLWLFWQPLLSWIMFSILLWVSARLERNWDFLCSRLINERRCLHNAGRSPFGVLLGN